MATTRYQIRLSTCLIYVLVAALTMMAWRYAAWLIAGRPVHPMYVYIRHNGQTVAIDARVWLRHQLNRSAQVQRRD